MTNEQNDNNLSPDREQVLTELADMLGDTDPTYLEVKNIIDPPEPEPEAEPQPPEHRPGWMDFDSRIGVRLDDEQRQAEKVQRRETDDREDAILNALQDGDRDRAARIGGQRAVYSNLQE